MLAATATGLFSTFAAMTAPCSVKAKGSLRRPPHCAHLGLVDSYPGSDPRRGNRGNAQEETDPQLRNAFSLGE